MSVQPSRLRGGEWLAALGVVVMVAALFGLHWYGASGTAGARAGWSGTSHLHWALLVAVVVGLGLVVAQAACRAPALPACLSVISSVIAFLTLLWLVYRVVLNAPSHQLAGAWVELAGGLALFVGSYWSMRQEGIRPQDGPGEIPVLRLPPATQA